MQHLPQDEVLEHPESLHITKFIDAGSFGTVYQAVHQATGKLYAIKRIPNYATITNKAAGNKIYARKIVREVVILSILNRDQCEYIVPLNLVYLSTDKRDVYLVMPFIEFNLDHIVQEYVLREPEIKAISYQLLEGIRCCHERHFMHRDLTLKNVLVDSNSHVSIADFGLSRCKDTAEEEATLDVVTLEYRAPELLLRYKKYDTRVDIWSIGCMIAEMYLRRRLLTPECRDEQHQVRKIIQQIGEPDMATVNEYGGHTTAPQFVSDLVVRLKREGVLGAPFEAVAAQLKQHQASDDAIDLIRWMLQFDFRARPTAAEALEHRWFADDPDMQQGGADGGDETTGGSQSDNPAARQQQQQQQQQHQIQPVQQQQPQQQPPRENSVAHGSNGSGLSSASSPSLHNHQAQHQQHESESNGDRAMKSGSSPIGGVPPNDEHNKQLCGRDDDDDDSVAVHKRQQQQQHQQQHQHQPRSRQVGADGAALLSPVPDLSSVTDAILLDGGDENENEDGNNSNFPSPTAAAAVAAASFGAKVVSNDGAAVSDQTNKVDERAQQQQQQPRQPSSPVQWLSVSVDCSGNENNDILTKIQTMKLSQLVSFMEALVTKDVTLIRGQYQINSNDKPGMVFEHSRSPVDST